MYRSAISSVHEMVDGYTVGQHPVVSRLVKGVYNDIPPLPRYSSTWNVQTVLLCISSWRSNESLSPKFLAMKTTMLLALTHPSRSADLLQLSLLGRQYKPDGVLFLPRSLAKQFRQGKPVTSFFLSILSTWPSTVSSDNTKGLWRVYKILQRIWGEAFSVIHQT